MTSSTSRYRPRPTTPGAPTRRTGRAGGAARCCPASLEALALPIAWVVVIVIFSVLRPGTFLSSANFASILASQAVLVVVSLALVIVLTAGDYDLSVASVVGLSANLIAILNVNYGLPVARGHPGRAGRRAWSSAWSTGCSWCSCRSTASSSRWA